MISPVYQTKLDKTEFSQQDLLAQTMKVIKTLPFNEGDGNIYLGNLNCDVSTDPAKKWSYRLEFIEEILKDVFANCPKDEPLVLVSLGSAFLLLEYCIACALIKCGNKNITILLVDPTYAEGSKSVDIVLNEFRLSISDIYPGHLEKERIKFLSCAQNVKKYFPKSANVIVLESFPPNQPGIRGIKFNKLKEKNHEDMLLGDNILQSSKGANAMALIPYLFYNKNIPSIPFQIKMNLDTQKNYYVDWGCKIFSDWTYKLTFTGIEEYLEDTMTKDCLSKDRYINEGKIILGQHSEKDEKIDLREWYPKLKESLEVNLDQQIAEMRKQNPNSKTIPQETVSTLLEAIKKIVDLKFPSIECLFTRDYAIDKKEMLSDLSQNAGSNYRKIFTHVRDENNLSCIKSEEIK